MTESEERGDVADGNPYSPGRVQHVIWGNGYRAALASSPPVPQQLAKLKSALYDISSGDFDATDDEVRALMCVIQELHLDQRLRDVKTNQEIDAMVREMKQPSDEKDAARYRLLRNIRSGFEVTLKGAMYWNEGLDSMLDAALHAEPVEKMKGEGA